MSGFAYSVQDGAARELALADALRANGDLVWIHLTDSDEDARRWLTGEARLPDYATDALTAAETRPRCDAMQDGAFVNLRGLSSEATTSEPLASVRLYATAGRVYSVTRRPLCALDMVKRTVAAGRVHDPGDLIAEFATAITEGLDPVVANLGDSLDECETKLDAGHAFELRRDVTHARTEAIGYRRFLFPQRAALDKLAALPGDWLRDDDRQHLASAADRAARMAEEVEAIRERAAVMHETLTDLRAELLDQRSLTIAIAAMIFLPLTFLTGLLGMNVEGIPFAHEPWAFWGVVGLCLVLGGLVALYFTWKHWTR
jgi:zinc transporter